jgi:hypothetical protein
MIVFRKALKLAAPALFAIGLGLWAPDTAQAGPPSTRGYDLQQRSSGRYTGPASFTPPVAVSPRATPAPVFVRSGPTIVPPATLPSAPAVTGNAAADPKSGAVIIWYEYIPSLGGWIEFRGVRVSGPPSPSR